MLEPTPKQRMEDIQRRRNAYIDANNLRRTDELPDEVESQFWTNRARGFCANPDCLKPWLRTEEVSPLKACSRCKWTYYCSVSHCSSIPPKLIADFISI